MFFCFSERADKNSGGKVDMWEAAKEFHACDSIMGTNSSGFCTENDEDDYDEE